MNELEEKTVEICAPKEERPLLYRYSKFLVLLITLLVIACSVIIHKRFVKHSDAITFSAEIKVNPTKVFTEKITIEKGKTIGKILSIYDISYQDINKILKAAASKGINLGHLKPEQTLELQYFKNELQPKTISYLNVSIDQQTNLKIIKDPKTDAFQASIVPLDVIKEIVPLYGKIKNSLMVAAIQEGVPISNLIEATNACSYEIDFQRDIKDGDSFKILLEKITSKEDGNVFFGKTLYFALELSGKKYKLYKFTPQGGQEAFFTEEYKSAKRGLLKTPLSVSRVSSKFGIRKHPILGYSLMHKGIDFAAPKGTAIYSAGTGTILDIGRNRGLGNYVKVKHNDQLSTVYGHISRFAKNLKKGERVKQGQIIAFVGATGRATGPHLHYEMLLRDRHIDPFKFKLPSTTTLKGEDVKNFEAHKTYVDSLLKDNLFS